MIVPKWQPGIAIADIRLPKHTIPSVVTSQVICWGTCELSQYSTQQSNSHADMTYAQLNRCLPRTTLN